MAEGLEVLIPAPSALDLTGFSFGGIIGGLVAGKLGRHMLASVQGALDLRVIEGAGHRVPYGAADQVTAALFDLLARGSAPLPAPT